MNGQLTIKYRCRGCGEHEVSVPYRRSDEDVVDWMRNVVEMAVASDHAKERCATPACDIKIPITGAEWIGGPPIN